MFWLIIGFVAGLFVPAPYDAMARAYLGPVWQMMVVTVSGWISKVTGTAVVPPPEVMNPEEKDDTNV